MADVPREGVCLRKHASGSMPLTITLHLTATACHLHSIRISCACWQGESGKMSASDPNSAVFVTDSPKDIKSKVGRQAYVGVGMHTVRHTSTHAGAQL